MINNRKEYLNRYDAGQFAVDRNDWRLAYDCFMDCQQYLKYYEPWNEIEIKKMEVLISNCNKMFR